MAYAIQEIGECRDEYFMHQKKSTTTPGGGGGGGYSPMVAPMQMAASTVTTFSGKLIATKTLDTTSVDAQAGTGSALFGVLAVKDSSNNLLVYYTNSNTNTLNVLKQ